VSLFAELDPLPAPRFARKIAVECRDVLDVAAAIPR